MTTRAETFHEIFSLAIASVGFSLIGSRVGDGDNMFVSFLENSVNAPIDAVEKFCVYRGLAFLFRSCC